MTLRHRIVRNLTAGAFGRLVNALGPLFLLPMFLSQWGSTLYGEWILVTAVPACIMLAPDFGVALAVANRMAALTGEGKRHDAQDLFRSSFWLLLACSAIFAACGSIAAALIPWGTVFGLRTITPNTASAIIAIFCFQLIGHQLINCIFGVYRCALRSSRAAFIASLFGVAELILTVSGLRFGASPLVLACFGLCWKLLMLAFYMFDSARLKDAPRLGFKGIHLGLIRPLLLPAFGCGGLALLQAVQNQGIPTLIGFGLGAKSVAAFQSVRVMINAFKSVFNLVSMAVLIELPHALGQRQTVAIGRLLRRLALFGILMAIITIFGTWLCGEWIYARWTSGNIEYNQSLAIILAIAILPYLMGTPASIYLYAANQIHAILWLVLACLLISLVAMVPLMPVCGVVAGGFATVIWEVLQAGVLTWYFRRTAPEIWTSFVTNNLDSRRFFDDFRNLVRIGRAPIYVQSVSTSAQLSNVLPPASDESPEVGE